MGVDLSVFDRIKTKADYDRENEAFQLAKRSKLAALNGQDPAAVKLANELQNARASGDVQRMNDLIMSAKLVDRGVVMGPDGTPIAMGGYGDAVGSIEGAKAGYKQNAQNASDLSYAAPIAGAKKQAEITANQMGGLQDKADKASSMDSLTADARNILNQGNATGGYLGAGWNIGKKVFGVSDDTTQANSKLQNIAASLTASVPRFEGPQSDADRAYYEKMAGQVGDVTIPIGDRLAALDQIDKINQKYANVQTPAKTTLYGNVPMLTEADLEDPVMASRQAIDQRNKEMGGANPYGQPALKKGAIDGGYMYVGGDPSSPDSWKKVK